MSKCLTLTQGNTRSNGRHIWLGQRLKEFVSRSFLSKNTTQWIQWNFKGATFDQSQRRNLWLVNCCDNTRTWTYTLSNILMPCEAQLLTQSQSLRHTYSPLAQLSSPEDFLQVQSTVECYGATFDFHEAQCLTIYIYIYMFISQAQVCDICIYTNGATFTTERS